MRQFTASLRHHIIFALAVTVTCQIQLSAQTSAVPAQRPRLRIINGTDSKISILWVDDNGKRTPNGTLQPGEDTVITTTLGHRFAIVDEMQQSEQFVTCEVPIQAYRVGSIPNFYTQRTDAHGLPVVASAKVSPYALREAVYIIDRLLANRPDVRQAMIQSGARCCILAHNEFTTDQPEWAWMAKNPVRGFESIDPRDYRDARSRGMGGSKTDPFFSCAEENLLAYPGDPYSTENILIHEIAHNIHLRGLTNVDPTFDHRLKMAYESAMNQGLWAGKYASVNRFEYFAEGVQSWFDDNREDDHDHNHVDTRVELLQYDPRLAALCREVFGETEFRYIKPTQRLKDHLKGYDPSQAPRFKWPERLKAAKKAIHAAAQK
ncbi:MAG: hypothetical protein AAFN70_05610, partial [Planctomycetota bacterium]